MHQTIQALGEDPARGSAGQMDDREVVDDSVLVSRLLTGDGAAFELLYDRHHRAAYGYANRILGEPESAEDVTQEAFLTLWRRAARYNHTRAPVQAWLLTIVHHRAIDAVRRRHMDRYQTAERLLFVAAPADTWEQVSQNIEGEAVRDALRRLPPDQRQAMMLAYVGPYARRDRTPSRAPAWHREESPPLGRAKAAPLRPVFPMLAGEAKHAMDAYPISPAINSPRNNDADLIKPEVNSA